MVEACSVSAASRRVPTRFTWNRLNDDILQTVVEEFRAESLAKGREIACDIEAGCRRSARIARRSRALSGTCSRTPQSTRTAGTPIRVFATRRRTTSCSSAVGDSGAGIPPGERDRIFQKFVRGADAKRAGVRGVGIGLALVKRIAEAHGGSVRLESEPGRGSTFTLVLPCHAS